MGLHTAFVLLLNSRQRTPSGQVEFLVAQIRNFDSTVILYDTKSSSDTFVPEGTSRFIQRTSFVPSPLGQVLSVDVIQTIKVQ